MILLYNPPSSAHRKPVLPMSLLALGAMLEGHLEYAILDGNLLADPYTALDRAIRERDVRLLGVTIMPGPQLEAAVPLCRRLKAAHPHLTIVWGGYFPTLHYDACLRAGYVDYVVRGCGEHTFAALARALLTDGAHPCPAERAPGPLPGLAHRTPGSGEIVANGVCPLPDPDDLPEWPYHRVDVARYARPTFMGRRTLPHHSSYGCPFRCNFCAVVGLSGGRWVAESAQRTAAVTHRLVKEWGADSIEFYDNNFFVSEARTAEFAGRIAGLGIHWWGEARIDTLLRYDERTWERMRASGLKMVFVGAESGSDETLRRMNKGGQAAAARALEIAQKMAHYGIVPEMSFVLGNPPDPAADAHQTMAFIRRVKQVNPETEIVLYLNTPVPPPADDPALLDPAAVDGFLFPETLDEWLEPQWAEFSQRRNPGTPWLGDSLRAQIHDFQHVLNAYYPTVTDPRLAGVRRWIPRTLAAWRYHLRVYRFPIELRLLNRLMGYRRPETSGL